MTSDIAPRAWPDIPYTAWKETCSALHLWGQIVGKYRLAHTPWVNHSWHATFYVTPRGLTTGPIPDPGGAVTVDFDFHDHRLVAQANNGQRSDFPLEAMSVAAFWDKTHRTIEAVGGTARIHGKASEMPEAVVFEEDVAPRPYDAEAVARFHGALVRIERVFARFRTGFLGKVSPVHLFWGAFDLAVTRFSGRTAPLHPGGFPNLPDAVTREAYSHEVSSAGFWPGGGGVDEPMFYSYAYPQPGGFRLQTVQPDGAYFDETLGEFLLPYAVVRRAENPEALLMAFLQSTYDAAAQTGNWDRRALECSIGKPLVPRELDT